MKKWERERGERTRQMEMRTKRKNEEERSDALDRKRSTVHD